MATLRQRVMWWLWDERRPDWLHDRGLAGLAARACCAVWGHTPTCNQCGRPEHDHCAWCQTPMPGAAHRERGAGH